MYISDIILTMGYVRRVQIVFLIPQSSSSLCIWIICCSFVEVSLNLPGNGEE